MPFTPTRLNRTYSHTSLPTCPEELRSSHTQLPYQLWLQESKNTQFSQLYYLTLNHIISDITPTTLDELRIILRQVYLIDHQLIENFIQFIIICPTLGIEFLEESDCRKPVIFKKPRSKVKVSIVGAYDVFVPDSKLKVKPRGDR